MICNVIIPDPIFSSHYSQDNGVRGNKVFSRTFKISCSCTVGKISVRINLPLFEVTSTPTRPVENVVLATKGLQDRNNC